MLKFPDDAILLSRPQKIKNGLIVVLPSVGRNHIPKFSRHSWKEDFFDYAFMAVADPQMILVKDIEGINGTWFLSDDASTESWLVPLRDKIKNIITENGCDIEEIPIVFAGSSMGGYAALIMSSFFKKSFAFSECPQVVLERYRHSNYTIECLRIPRSNSFTDLRLFFNNDVNKPAGKIFCSLSDKDHLDNHISPLLKALSEDEGYTTNAKRKLEFSFNVGGDTPIGHKQLSRERFKNEVLALLNCLK